MGPASVFRFIELSNFRVAPLMRPDEVAVFVIDIALPFEAGRKIRILQDGILR